MIFQDKTNITRCTQAVLRAFDIEGYSETGSGVLEYLREAGYKIDKIPITGTLRSFYTSELNDFRHNYMVFTPGHVLAIMQGKVVCTVGYNADSRTRVEHVWRVTK